LLVNLGRPLTLDNAESVADALKLLERVQIVAAEARGHKATVHLAIEDASGDSAIIEHIRGKPVNQRRHGVSFEEAATVFDDPLFVLQDASRNEQQRRRDWLQLCGSIANSCAHRGRRGIHTDYLRLARFGGRGNFP